MTPFDLDRRKFLKTAAAASAALVLTRPGELWRRRPLLRVPAATNCASR